MQTLFDNWTGRYDDECLMPGDIVEAAMVYNFRENAGNQTDTMIQMGEVADIVGNLPIYDTIYKENRYSPWKYAGQCYPGELQNRNPALMPMCYICSRYRADTREELEENIKVAKWAASKVVSEGKIPIAPHLYFPRFMDDSIAGERYFGMEAGKRLMMQCKEFLVVTVDNVISEGMNEEIDYMTNKLMMQGKSINFTSGTVKQGGAMDAAVTVEVVYIMIELDGKQRVELDKLNNVYKVNGVDLLAKIRKQC